MAIARAGLSGMHLRVAVLLKEVPRFESMELGEDGHLVRDGVEVEMGPFCRRAVAKGIELAKATGGECVAITMGPPGAEGSLREAIACGADRAVLLSDPAFAGSDTLATARALTRVLEKLGPFDLVLTGRNSVDSDTGQVGPQIAAFLDRPFLCSVRELELGVGGIRACCDHDDVLLDVQAAMPAVISVAERLCAPAKAPAAARAAVDAARIDRLRATDIGDGPWGLAGSPTRVGEVTTMGFTRARIVLRGAVVDQVDKAVDALVERGALANVQPEISHVVPDAGAVGVPIGVIIEPSQRALARELCGAAAQLVQGACAATTVTALAFERIAGRDIGAWGGDSLRAHVGPGATMPETAAHAVALWARAERPWAILAPSTSWGREVAGRVAALTDSGLTGDAIELEVRDGRLVAWKPAFGGGLVAAITARSPIQMVTVRPGALPSLSPRVHQAARIEARVSGRGRTRIIRRRRVDDIDALGAANVVVGVGTGVLPDEYGQLTPLLSLLGGELAATRPVTDAGSLPRSRQVGITGRSIAPQLYIGIGVGGSINHTIGLRRAGTILAINSNPNAAIFLSADIGIVADWHDALPLLVGALEETLGRIDVQRLRATLR